MNYVEFLDSKRQYSGSVGVTCDLTNTQLFPFQQVITKWALRHGRAAIFADCGLGKTYMQLEWLRHLPKPSLILAPLTVAHQTIREAQVLGVSVTYCTDKAAVNMDGINITNYERLSQFDGVDFEAVVLDESSILKNVDGRTRIALTERFEAAPYRLACTATPSPNDIAELTNHAEWLGVATRQEVLSMFFVHDGNEWRLKGHAKQAFYRWVASWASFVRVPSDIGFSDDGYILPELAVRNTFLPVDLTDIAQSQGRLFFDGLAGIQGRVATRQATIDSKVAHVKTLIDACPNDQFVIWVGLNDEGRAIKGVLPDATLMEGSDTPEKKEADIQAFIDGRARVLITKTSIAGFGLNLQNCHRQVFCGLSDSYEQYYQAIRRSWRFGQSSPVDVNIVLTEAERGIWENVERKYQMNNQLQDSIIDYVGKYQAEQLGLAAPDPVAYDITDYTRQGDWQMYKGDCVEIMGKLETDSIDFSVFSPPFLDLYVYSDSELDVGNSKSEAEFAVHMGFVAAQLRRVIKPGRIAAIHISQVPAQKVRDGYIGMKDFHGLMVKILIDAGMIYHGEIIIDKDPQAQAIRTKAKGLLFAQLRKDASWLRPGLADYILLFRVPGENEVPINPDITNDQWIEWARPVWYNVLEGDTLNAREARVNEDERHLAPLQLGTIERCMRLWSNPGETVLSPFGGIGSEGYVAVKAGRRFVGIELKPAYYHAAIRNLTKAEQSKTQLSMAL